MTLFNPAAGALAGIAWGDKLNDRDFQAERASVVKDIDDTQIECYGRRAMADASRALLDVVIAELHALQQGRLAAPRLSHPANTAGRNEAFADTTHGQISRLSNGKLGIAADSLARIKAARVEVDVIMTKGDLVPKVEIQKPR